MDLLNRERGVARSFQRLDNEAGAVKDALSDNGLDSLRQFEKSRE